MIDDHARRAFEHLTRLGWFYVLDGHDPVPADADDWGRMFADTDARRVDHTVVAPGIWVSTVFLGIDHRFHGDGPPILFETMAFSDTESEVGGIFGRYATWDEAQAGHDLAVAELTKRIAHQ